MNGNLYLRADGDPVDVVALLEGSEATRWTTLAPLGRGGRREARQGRPRLRRQRVRRPAASPKAGRRRTSARPTRRACRRSRSTRISCGSSCSRQGRTRARRRSSRRRRRSRSGATCGSSAGVADASSARRAADGGIDVSGSIGSSSGPLRYSLVVDDPALFTAGALRAALQSAGITVDGTVQARARRRRAREKVAELRLAAALADRLGDESREHQHRGRAALPRRGARVGAERHELGRDRAREPARLPARRRSAPIRSAIDVSDGSGLSTLDSLTPRTMIAAAQLRAQGRGRRRSTARCRSPASRSCCAGACAPRRRRATCTRRRARRTP